MDRSKVKTGKIERLLKGHEPKASFKIAKILEGHEPKANFKIARLLPNKTK